MAFAITSISPIDGRYSNQTGKFEANILVSLV